MNKHTVTNTHSKIIEAIAFIQHCTFDDMSIDFIDKDLITFINKQPVFKQIKGEKILTFTFSEALLYTRERQNIHTFISELTGMDVISMQQCIFSDFLKRDEFIHTIRDKQMLDEFMTKQLIQDQTSFVTLLNNPLPFFEEFTHLLLKVYTHKSFQAIFTPTVEADLKSAHNEIDQSLINQHPLSYAQFIMGKNFYNISDWDNYEFYIVYCLHSRAYRLMNDRSNIMLIRLHPPIIDETSAVEKLSKSLKTLSDSTRLMIVKMIYNKPMSGKAIAESTGLTTATISHHIDVIRKVGLLNEERDKNTKFFSINRREFDSLMKSLDSYIRKF